MATANGGRFRVSQLTFNVTGNRLVVGCGVDSARVDMAQVNCGQNTAKTFELEVGAGNLAQLKDALKTVLDKLETL
jgi:hypothetical protein